MYDLVARAHAGLKQLYWLFNFFSQTFFVCLFNYIGEHEYYHNNDFLVSPNHSTLQIILKIVPFRS